MTLVEEPAPEPSEPPVPILAVVEDEAKSQPEEESLEALVEAAAHAQRSVTQDESAIPPLNTSIAMVVPAKLLFNHRS
jgi:hypothetical protein